MATGQMQRRVPGQRSEVGGGHVLQKDPDHLQISLLNSLVERRSTLKCSCKRKQTRTSMSCVIPHAYLASTSKVVTSGLKDEFRRRLFQQFQRT